MKMWAIYRNGKLMYAWDDAPCLWRKKKDAVQQHCPDAGEILKKVDVSIQVIKP